MRVTELANEEMATTEATQGRRERDRKTKTDTNKPNQSKRRTRGPAQKRLPAAALPPPCSRPTPSPPRPRLMPPQSRHPPGPPGPHPVLVHHVRDDDQLARLRPEAHQRHPAHLHVPRERHGGRPSGAIGGEKAGAHVENGGPG